MLSKSIHTALSSISRKLKFLPRGRVGVMLNKLLIPTKSTENQIISFETDAGLVYICDLRSYTENYVCWTGEYEGKTMAKVLSLVDPNKNILDIGANVGYWTINLASKIGPNTKLFAFEPVPNNYRRILEHLKVNSLGHKVQVLNIGLGETAMMADFRMNAEDEKSQASTYNAALVQGEVGQISVQTLDSVVSTNQISQVGFIKIDVEGYELSVFRGAKKFLQDNRPLIYGEFTPSSIQKYGYDPSEIFSIFSDYTFYQEVQAGVFRSLAKQSIYQRDLLLIPDEKAAELEPLILG